MTTGQQLLMMAGPQGIGGGLGALLGGRFMRAHGGQTTYEYAAKAAAALGAVHVGACGLLWLCGRPTLLRDADAKQRGTLGAEPLIVERADGDGTCTR